MVETAEASWSAPRSMPGQAPAANRPIGTTEADRGCGSSIRRHVAAVPAARPGQQVREHVRAPTGEPALPCGPVAAEHTCSPGSARSSTRSSALTCSASVTTLMAAITPIALTAMTLWVGLYGWAVLRNEVSETLPNFMWKVFKIGLVLAFALQSGFYIGNVADTANALAMGVATTFLPGGSGPDHGDHALRAARQVQRRRERAGAPTS